MEGYVILCQIIITMNVDVLKLKVIDDYKNLINILEKGYTANYNMIMLNILFIEYGDKDEKIFEFLLNN